MSNFRRSFTVPIALGLLVLAGPALAGCSVQGIVNSATGGNVTLPGKSVPADFPREIPLAKGTVVLGGALGDGKGGKIWNVTIELESATIETISAEITAAGFTSNGAISASANGGTATFDNAAYSLIVVVAKAEGKSTANYTVTTIEKK